MRYEVTCSVDLVIEADSQREAKTKALQFLSDSSLMPDGVLQLTTWHVRVTDLDDTQPELEDDAKWEHR